MDRVLAPTATGLLLLAQGGSVPKRVVFEVRLNGGTISTTLVAAPNGAVLTAARNVSYVNRNAPTTVVSGATAITADGLFEVDATGLDVFLSIGAVSGGVRIHVKEVVAP